MIRLYVNTNNKCNVDCDFCCMYSGTSKTTFMDFDTYKNIIDSYDDNFELQVEGGEPLLNPLLYLFLWYAISTNRCKKIILSTNGIVLQKHIDKLIEFSSMSRIPFMVKMSINYYLLKEYKDLFEYARDISSAVEFIDGFDITFNVRIRKDDGWIVDKLKEYKILTQSNVFEFQSYGKYTNHKEYSKPFIRKNIDDWFIYASDGTFFNKDLIKRSEYEKNLK